jgi:hypothetical protein
MTLDLREVERIWQSDLLVGVLYLGFYALLVTLAVVLNHT